MERHRTRDREMKFSDSYANGRKNPWFLVPMNASEEIIESSKKNGDFLGLSNSSLRTSEAFYNVL